MTENTLTLFRDPVALRAAAEAVPYATLEHFRGIFVATLRAKAATLKKGDAAAVNAVANAAEFPTMGIYRHDQALRVMLASGIPANFYERKLREGTQSFNAKAIPKAVTIAPKLLSKSPTWGTGKSGSMEQTIRGTIQGLLEGAGSGRKSLASFLDRYMSERNYGQTPGQYTAGDTQSSSSAHALASLGLLAIDRAGDYVIREREILEALLGRQGDGNATDTDDAIDYAWG